MSPPSVPRLLHVLPFRLMSLVADTALPVGGFPSSLPGIGLAVVDKVGSVPAVVDMVVVVVLATVYILFPLRVRENGYSRCLLWCSFLVVQLVLSRLGGMIFPKVHVQALRCIPLHELVVVVDCVPIPASLPVVLVFDRWSPLVLFLSVVVVCLPILVAVLVVPGCRRIQPW
jgi:hypothetical protein